MGYSVGWESYGPTEDRLLASKDFNMPAKPSITGIRGWFGLVNQLAPFIATAPVMASVRDLPTKETQSQICILG